MCLPTETATTESSTAASSTLPDGATSRPAEHTPSGSGATERGATVTSPGQEETPGEVTVTPLFVVKSAGDYWPPGGVRLLAVGGGGGGCCGGRREEIRDATQRRGMSCENWVTQRIFPMSQYFILIEVTALHSERRYTVVPTTLPRRKLHTRQRRSQNFRWETRGSSRGS